MGLKWKTEVGNDDKAKKFQQAYDGLLDARAKNNNTAVETAVKKVGQAIEALDPNNKIHEKLMGEVKALEESRNSMRQLTSDKASKSSIEIVSKITEQNTPERKEEFKRTAEINKIRPSITATLESGLKQMEATDAKITAAQKKMAEEFERKTVAKEAQIQQQKAERDAKFFGGQTQKAESAAKKEAEKQRSEQEKAIKVAAQEREALAKAERKDVKGMNAEVDREYGDKKLKTEVREPNPMYKPNTQVKGEIKEGNPLYSPQEQTYKPKNNGKIPTVSLKDSNSMGISQEERKALNMDIRAKNKLVRDILKASEKRPEVGSPEWNITPSQSQTPTTEKKSFASKFKSAIQAKATNFADKVKAAKAQFTGKHTGGRE